MTKYKKYLFIRKKRQIIKPTEPPKSFVLFLYDSGLQSMYDKPYIKGG
jgi:hypothetical protein